MAAAPAGTLGRLLLLTAAPRLPLVPVFSCFHTSPPLALNASTVAAAAGGPRRLSLLAAVQRRQPRRPPPISVRGYRRAWAPLAQDACTAAAAAGALRWRLVLAAAISVRYPLWSRFFWQQD